MESKVKQVEKYLKEQLKDKTITKADKTAIKATIAYLKNKQITSRNKMKEFKEKYLENKERWFGIPGIEGVSFDDMIIEHEDRLNISMNTKSNKYGTWIFNVIVDVQNIDKCIFSSVLEEGHDFNFIHIDDCIDEIEKLINSKEYIEFLEDVKKFANQ